jgi:hypothetical protein
MRMKFTANDETFCNVRLARDWLLVIFCGGVTGLRYCGG